MYFSLITKGAASIIERPLLARVRYIKAIIGDFINVIHECDLLFDLQTVASGGWPQPEAPEAARFATLQEHYRTLAQREKLEKETRRFCGRKLSYMQLTDKYGLSAAVARKRAGLPPLHSLSLKPGQESPGGGGGQVTLAPCQAKNIEDVEVLPSNELFSETPVNLTQVRQVY